MIDPKGGRVKKGTSSFSYESQDRLNLKKQEAD